MSGHRISNQSDYFGPKVTLFKTFGSKTHGESLWYVVLAAQSCLSKYYRRASIPGEIWAAKDEGKERKPHCASASCLPEARTFPFRPRAAPKLYLSDPNSISQFFTSHTTLSIKLSVSHFFNCPQATKLNLCLSDKFCCLWSKVKFFGSKTSYERAQPKQINLDINHIGLGDVGINQGVR